VAAAADISDDDVDVDGNGRRDMPESEEEDEFATETPADKRLRLAKSLIAQMETEERGQRAKKPRLAAGHGGGSDSGDSDSDGDDLSGIDRGAVTAAVAGRLRTEMLADRGTLHRDLAGKVDVATTLASVPLTSKTARLPLTCVCVSHTGKHVYTAGKDAHIVKWAAATLARVVVFEGWSPANKDAPGHTGHVLAMALSSDDKFLASGGADKSVLVWDAGWLAGWLVGWFGVGTTISHRGFCVSCVCFLQWRMCC
jgi:ribosomal RNA-processing protein 9